MTYFKTDVENASFSAAKNHAICTLGGVSEILAFQEGAKWGRERGFMEAVELVSQMPSIKNVRPFYGTELGAWLLEKRKEMGK